MNLKSNLHNGFTLIEVMVVVVIMSILAAIAMPLYSQHARKASAAKAQQEMQNIAVQLEKTKNRNFNYRKFATGDSTNKVSVLGGKYTITVRDGTNTSLDLTHDSALGQSWVIVASSEDPKNYGFFMSSQGQKCKNLTSSLVTYSGCGKGSEVW